jgi:hypothetical protein
VKSATVTIAVTLMILIAMMPDIVEVSMRAFERSISIAVMCVLVAANLVALLPPQMTFVHFKWMLMGPAQLELRVTDTCSSVIVVDPASLVINGAVSAWPGWERFINRRRIDHLMRTARIALYVQPENEDEYLLRTWRADEVWRPDESSRVRFVLHDAFDLPSGTYEVRAVLYGDAPWGTEWPGYERLALWPELTRSQARTGCSPGAPFIEPAFMYHLSTVYGDQGPTDAEHQAWAMESFQTRVDARISALRKAWNEAGAPVTKESSFSDADAYLAKVAEAARIVDFFTSDAHRKAMARYYRRSAIPGEFILNPTSTQSVVLVIDERR